MRARNIAPAVLATVAALAGCSSSGSGAAPASSLSTSTRPPSPAATGVPAIGEAFSLLPCPTHRKTTVAIEGCLEHRIVGIDKQIDNIARSLYARMNDPQSARHFAAAEQAWIAYRRAACISDADAYAGGTLAPVEFANCELRLNRQRLGDLKELAGEAAG